MTSPMTAPSRPQRVLRRLPILTVLLGLTLLALPFERSARAEGLAALSSALEARFDLLASLPPGESERTALQAGRLFYESRDYRPAWVGEAAVTPRGDTLARILMTSDLDGLLPANYASGEIAALLSSDSLEGLTDLEFRLTQSLLLYGRDLSAGRMQPAGLDSDVFFSPDPVKSMSLLTTAASTEDLEGYLAGLQPQSDNYARLRAALADHRAIAAKGGWSRVPEGPTLAPGARGDAVAALRKRLVEAGDLDASSAGGQDYDDAVAQAVRRFQLRHGLEPDGAVGPNTRAALNVPVETRIEQMLLNMERRRWMPDDLGARHVFVNLADSAVKVVIESKTIYASSVSVGRPYNRTPIFTGTLGYLVLNPAWYAPSSFAQKVILPALRKEAGFLAKTGFTVLSDWSASARVLDPGEIDWAKVPDREIGYRFRQEPGDNNVLGRVKFMLPNQFNIFLHDTPAKSLFERSERSFDHGYIRIGDAAGLAAAVLHGMADWTPERIQEGIAGGTRQTVRLETPMPVHITYLTTWVNKDRSVHFRSDPYGRDKRLRDAMARANVTGGLAQ